MDEAWWYEACQWAAKMVLERATLLHKDHLVVGRASGWYDGRTRMKDGCTAPVLEFENGHSFVVNPVHFVRLSPVEAAFYHVVAKDLSTLVHRTAAVAALGQVPPKASFDLLLAALRAAARSMERSQQEAT